jgi:rhodanese-related sulfurtransferase
MTREIDVAELSASRADGAVIVDVREPEEYMAGHVAAARLIPLAELAERAAELPRDDRVHVICASGHRSSQAAQWLAGAGYDAASVAGGTQAWADSGRPLVTGTRPDAA